MMDTLDTIDVPTLILVGEDDAPFLRACDVMAGKITGSRLVRIPAAGHLANLDNPAAFDDALGGFLRALP
jgi:pimeloyl-ACP methyl ester carboxylesterase